jgi:thiopurine S-methyltransferase
MYPEFWHQRWVNKQTGFHEPAVNRLLVTHLPALGLARGARVLLPLCGKTLDIDWLLAVGFRVAGVELSGLAVAQLFERLGVTPVVRSVGALECHSTTGLDVFVGDIFGLSAEALGAVDAVYDRAALIALPPAMRLLYARHVRALAGGSPQLVVTLEYDQQQMDGPPFAVCAAELVELFEGCSPALLSRQDLLGGLKGQFPAQELVWRM